jgi:ATP/ADP translocase
LNNKYQVARGEDLLKLVAILAEDASFAYSINQVSKEILYVPLDPASKYKSKAFIDILGIRFAKAIAAGVILIYTLWLKKAGVPSTVLMGMNIILICFWLYAIYVVGREFEKKDQLDLFPALSN